MFGCYLKKTKRFYTEILPHSSFNLLMIMEKGGERHTRATWKGAETNRRDDGMVGQLFHKFEVNQETVWNVN